MTYEQTYLDGGQTVIVGMDEVGYGAWAGPVVAGAICLPLTEANIHDLLKGVKDSKQMTNLQRVRATELISQHALGSGVGSADPSEIDAYGLSEALNRAYARAYQDCVRHLSQPVQVLLIDGRSAWKNFPHNNVTVERIIKGDTLSLSIAAASVIAKVWRDTLMVEQFATRYPAYGFDRHKGYGTAYHLEAIRQHGQIRDVHRMNYALKL
ncbi:MAG: ribonuclease HII [Phototrophicaceae bacterium]|jgi:ribonuclease HII